VISLTSILYQVRKFITSVVLLIIGILVTTFLFEQLIAIPANLQILVIQAIEVAIIVASSLIVVFLIRRFRSSLSIYSNPQVAAVFSFFMILVTIIVAFFAVLYTFQVSVDTLLIGGGIVTLVIGLVISTVFGNVFAGALMLTTSPFRVGDNVLVNNIPGEIEEITSMFTRIRNNLGGETIIPNSALIQGAVTLTKIPSNGPVHLKLPYSTGDRIYTTYIGGEGVVTEITSFYTKILLDSSKEVTIPNNSIITGAIQIAKIKDNSDAKLSFSLRIDWNAEKTIEAIKDVTISDPATFKSPPVIHYSSLDGKTVELKVSCEVDPNKKNEAKSIILRTAYLSRSQS
jgi:small-conductance mechanosensitive channel